MSKMKCGKNRENGGCSTDLNEMPENRAVGKFRRTLNLSGNDYNGNENGGNTIRLIKKQSYIEGDICDAQRDKSVNEQVILKNRERLQKKISDYCQ